MFLFFSKVGVALVRYAFFLGSGTFFIQFLLRSLFDRASIAIFM